MVIREMEEILENIQKEEQIKCEYKFLSQLYKQLYKILRYMNFPILLADQDKLVWVVKNFEDYLLYLREWGRIVGGKA